jgi:uncharacterized delta-60 repeat protein
MALLLVPSAAAAAAGTGGSTNAVRLPTAGLMEEGVSVVADGPSHLLYVDEGEDEEPTSLVRVGLDRSLDPTFGTGGKVTIEAKGVAVQGDGKILVATASVPEGKGPSDARVVRLLPDGEPDPSFGVEGHVDVHFGRRYDYGEAVAVEPDGDILLAGIRVDYSDEYGSENTLAVARLTPSGELDATFGAGGVRILPWSGELGAFDVAATRSGGIAVAGGNDTEGVILGLKKDGRVDRHFGDHGYFMFPFGRKSVGEAEETLFAPQMTEAPNGGLLLAASGSLPDGGFRVAALRLRPNGRVDRSYGHAGWALGPVKGKAWTEAAGVTVLPGGVLAVATSFVGSGEEAWDFGVTAFDRHGRLDRRFGHGGTCKAQLPGRQEALGIATVGRRAAVLGEDYKSQWLLACGRAGAGAARAASAQSSTVPGSIDRSFGRSGLATVTVPDAESQIEGFAVAADGRVYVLDGSLLLAFGRDGEVAEEFGEGGRISVAPSAGESEIAGLAVDSQGRVLVAGSIKSQVQGYFPAYTPYVTRILPSGARDPGFGTGGELATDLGLPKATTAYATSIVIDAEDRPIVAGSFGETTEPCGVTFGGGPSPYVARLTASGAIDPTFGKAGHTVLGEKGDVISLAPTPGGGLTVFSCPCASPPRVETPAPRFLELTARGHAAKPARHGGLPFTWGAPVVDPKGRIVELENSPPAAIEYEPDALVRTLPDGAPDPHFGRHGTVVLRKPKGASAFAVDAGGRPILASAAKGRTELWRFRANGKPDHSFGPGGRLTAKAGAPRAIAFDAAGRIYTVSQARSSSVSTIEVARFIPGHQVR